jgi:hypothetical protein
MKTTFKTPLQVEEISAPAHLRQAVNAANEAAFQINNGARNTCIETSHALQSYLTGHGHNARLVRSAFRHFPAEGWGAVLGDRDRGTGTGWAGHLTVECEGFLLDATADQVNDSPTRTGERATWVPPLIVPIWDGYEDGGYLFLEWADGSRGDYQRYYRQNGFSYQPASRRSYWGATLELMAGIIESSRTAA